jgi:hypothetical protein
MQKLYLSILCTSDITEGMFYSLYWGCTFKDAAWVTMNMKLKTNLIDLKKQLIIKLLVTPKE